MFDEGLFRRRKLPHIDVDDHPYFITACLAGSIPAGGLKRIKAYRRELDQRQIPGGQNRQQWEIKKHKMLFKLVDSILDGESAARHLADDRLASIVQEAFLHFAKERYYLYAFVVMPSHHHWLFLPRKKWLDNIDKAQSNQKSGRTPREIISHSIQSFTSNKCNKVLGKKGPFWQTETFDHYARNDDEFMRIIEYIEQNPVAAGLTSDPWDYPWSSAALRKTTGVRMGDPLVE